MALFEKVLLSVANGRGAFKNVCGLDRFVPFPPFSARISCGVKRAPL